MHKGNLDRCTESIRTARVSQGRLDEITDKIERDKNRIIKSNLHQKAKLLNELKTIHRVFEPRLYAIKENQEEPNQSGANENTVQNVENRAIAGAILTVKRPKLTRRARNRTEVHIATPEPRRRNTEPKMWRPFGERMPELAPSASPTGLKNSGPSSRQRSYRWCQPPNNEPERSRLAVQVERDYLAKLRNAAEKPRISQSMSSVSKGYLSFKRVLNNKEQSGPLGRKCVDPRFHSAFMDVAELSAIPEHTEVITQDDDSINSYLVIKDTQRNPHFNRRLSTPISKQQGSSSLLRPLGNPSMKGPERLSATDTGIPRLQTSVKQRPAVKGERKTTRKASERVIQERSRESEEEEILGTFDENPGTRKNVLPRNRQPRFRRSCSSKLLKPLGTGCFSESFQAV